VRLRFSGEIWYWRGPSPFHFVSVPDADAEQLHDLSHAVTYGWGMIPATATIASTEWTTSLFPKNGGYLVPIKQSVREKEDLDVGDVVTIALRVGES
jgi:hypothetical protein